MSDGIGSDAQLETRPVQMEWRHFYIQVISMGIQEDEVGDYETWEDNEFELQAMSNCTIPALNLTKREMQNCIMYLMNMTLDFMAVDVQYSLAKSLRKQVLIRYGYGNCIRNSDFH